MEKIIPLLIVFSLTACKNQILFQTVNSKNQNESFERLSKDYQHILSPDDKLALGIWDHDDISVGSPFSIYNTHESFGKWIMINKDSTACLPFIGKTKIAGLTISQAEELITSELSEFIKNPIIEIKVLNREVTLLGEIVKPGNYKLDKESNKLIEFIGIAEGFTYYANPKKIQLIRDNISYHLDFTNMSEFEKNNLFIKSKDIIYVPPKKSKEFDMKTPLLIPIASFLTSVGILVSVLTK